MITVSEAINSIRAKNGLTQESLARLLGVSFVSVNRWERGTGAPSKAQVQRILRLYTEPTLIRELMSKAEAENGIFASHGARQRSLGPLFEQRPSQPILSTEPLSPILERLERAEKRQLGEDLTSLLKRHKEPASCSPQPPTGSLSAGKNTYTYDAHTYHTKVPPQGIAEILKHYLPEGGLVLDLFAGSGMTGVAASVTSNDCILNELSPAACFIASQFLSRVNPAQFKHAVNTVLEELQDLRRRLYTTQCRECGRDVEALYFVWAYRVECSQCQHVFNIWDQCRSYGKRVRDHKVLTEFPCPKCTTLLKKSRLKRFTPEPVEVGYKCCRSQLQEVTHTPSVEDVSKILTFEYDAPLANGFVPEVTLPNGVNLNQPKKHGFTTIASLYTPRNLAIMSHLWRTIHRISDTDTAAIVAFVFTSLYQRVTRMSEFRFWGGSGNTHRYNVPFIYNESNVFRTFERKARTIQDYLETTGQHFQGKVSVINGSATDLSWLPDQSVDLIFTDPPFGSNINYSDMNFLWEAWLDTYTDTANEAIINKIQGKSLSDYEILMKQALSEGRRVLRDSGWLVLVFMNSSADVWSSLRRAIEDAGFKIEQIDIFDKQHGTFKHFVHENTAGCDLVLHCRPVLKKLQPSNGLTRTKDTIASITTFLHSIPIDTYRTEYLHVQREAEIDARKLYSEWLARWLLESGEPVDFSEFRDLVATWLDKRRARLEE